MEPALKSGDAATRPSLRSPACSACPGPVAELPLLFETADVCDARASKVCGMYVEDLDLRPDDEHARVHGKGGTVPGVLDDRGYVALDPRACRKRLRTCRSGRHRPLHMRA